MEESLGLSIEQFGVLDARFFPYFILFSSSLIQLDVYISDYSALSFIEKFC